MQNTRFAVALEPVRARWSNSSDASRSPTAIVRSDFSDFGVFGHAAHERLADAETAPAGSASETSCLQAGRDDCQEHDPRLLQPGPGNTRPALFLRARFLECPAGVRQVVRQASPTPSDITTRNA